MDFLRFLLMTVVGVGFGVLYHMGVPVLYDAPAELANTVLAALVGAIVGILIGIAGDLLIKE